MEVSLCMGKCVRSMFPCIFIRNKEKIEKREVSCMLPEAFTDRMKEMLGQEYPAFLQSYDETKKQSLRVNPLKGAKEHFLQVNPFSLTPVAWEENGYYYEEDDRPGKHPYHEAGVYYIQEASAMVPVTFLGAQPGERILDLCAAPGGKSTQIATAMKGKGLLVCNEIHPARAKILSENIERMGIRNALVVNHSPDELAEHFEGYFDRILVDAPCSGEGMFRKNGEAKEEWSLQNVQMCAKRQDEVLLYAARMLAPGGRLVYSTCTFAPEENEGSISRFLKNRPDFSIVPVEKTPGMDSGNPQWVEDAACGIEETIRLWPHKIKGEGHYVAVLQKEGILPKRTEKREGSWNCEKGISEKECQEYLEFKKEYIKANLEGSLLKFGEQLYLTPKDIPLLKGLKVLRPGLHLGTLKKNRFEPSHSLALALKPEEVLQAEDLSAKAGVIGNYLNGQTFVTQKKGWCLITVEGYSIGWGKGAAGIMKNHYPKGLRKTW